MDTWMRACVADRRYEAARERLAARWEQMTDAEYLDASVRVERLRLAAMRLDGLHSATPTPAGLTTCIYCNQDVHEVPIPAPTDDAAWAAIAREHGQDCEWVETRAHNVPASPTPAGRAE